MSNMGLGGGERSCNRPSGQRTPAAPSADDIFSQFFGSGASGSRGSASVFGEGWNGARKEPVERTLLCSLEDLYMGTTKKMKISQDVMDSTTGRLNSVQETLQIEIKRGWKKGTKITFPGKGTDGGGSPRDLVFTIDEKPHSVFKREGNDLIVTHNVSLVDALTDYKAQITTLDGRVLQIAINSIITPGYEEVVRGEGMPIQREHSRKGDLRIKFNVRFPNMLTAEEKSVIKQSIPSSRFL